MTSSNRVYLFDTTLRDGAQTQGVDFTVADKAAIARELDLLGIDYIEGGWPGANPTDDRFFADPPTFQNAKFVAFGMTRRAGRSAANDPGLTAILQTKARNVCIVGKTWDFHVDVALEARPHRKPRHDRRLDRPCEDARMDEVIFDAEHFFDGYKANPDYAMACLAGGRDGGRALAGAVRHQRRHAAGRDRAHRRRGGQDDPRRAASASTPTTTPRTPSPTSLAAVRAGARQVQGTINGIGERCGNANLVSADPQPGAQDRLRDRR